MERRVDYETLDKELNHYCIGWIEKIYVQRSFTIDVPDTNTLFNIIDVLWKWYEELRLRKIERTDYTPPMKAPKTKTWKWKWYEITIDEDGSILSWDTKFYYDA